MKIGHKKNSFRYFGYLNCKGKIPLCFFIRSKIKEFIITNTNCYRAVIFRFAVLGYVVTTGQVAEGILIVKAIGYLIAGKEIRFSHNPDVYKNSALNDEGKYIKAKLGYTDVKQIGDFWYGVK